MKSYHDTGVRLMVVRGIHALEPLLSGRIPEVFGADISTNTAEGNQTDSKSTRKHNVKIMVHSNNKSVHYSLNNSSG